MDTSATDSGARVTRSLRKRIASVDSDNSSRPGTPVPSKLIPILEISDSPSRSTRKVRRNSTSGVATPVKTPAKRVVTTPSIIVENIETITPGRRSTRRRSVTVHENDETSHTGLKISSFPALDEEIAAPEEKISRATRLQSKSPQLIIATKDSSFPALDEEIAAPEQKTSRATRSQSKSPQLIIATEASSFPALDEEIAAPEQKTSRTTRSQSKSPQPISTKALSPNRKPIKSPNENKTKDLFEKIAATDKIKFRVTRSKSKSPQQIVPSEASSSSSKESKNNELEQQKRRKPGPKSKTGGNEDLSDVEISVFENEIEELKNKSSNITTIVLTDDESNLTAPETIKEDKTLQDTQKSDLGEICDAINLTKNKLLNINEQPMEDNTNNNTSNMRCTEQETISTDATTTDINILKDNITNEHKQIEDPISPSQTESVNNAEEQIQPTLTSHNQVNIINVVCLTNYMKNGEVECGDKNLQENEIISSIDKDVEFNEKEDEGANDINLTNNIVSTLSQNSGEDMEDSNVNNCKTPSKKVDFASTPSNDKTIKYVYPKTPGSTKTSNSFIDDNSSRDSDGSFKAQNNPKVDFASSPSTDMTVKNVYHKTPVSMETSNSLIDDNSSRDYDGSFIAQNNPMATHSDNHQGETNRETIEQLENKEEEKDLSQIETNVTPIRVLKCARSLEIAESSTPINIEASKPIELLPKEDKNTTEAEPTSLNKEMEDETTEANTHDEGPFSNHSDDDKLEWMNPSVRGTTAEGAKLDVVVMRNDTSTNNCHDIIDSSVAYLKSNRKKNIIFSSDDEGEDVVEREQDDNDVECELAPGEIPYKLKHDFHDDEAMEVDDYESGDSMDSEEQREIEENKIPVDGESIGSHTTDEEYVDEEEQIDNADSFIVSDNEELQCSESNDEDELIDKEVSEHNRKKKKTYKRLQRLADSSSSSDEEEIIEPFQEKLIYECHEEENVKEETPIKTESNSGEFHIDTNNLLSKTSENIVLDSSKLSDSALRLHCTAEIESDEEQVDEEKFKMSRKEILHKLNQSDRLNKSVRDLNHEIDTSPVELETKTIPEMSQENNNNEKLDSFDKGLTTSTSSEEGNNSKLRSESHLEEVLVTSESDADKENGYKSLNLPYDRKPDSGLSVSFGNHSKGRQKCRKSIIVDVTLKCGDLKTADMNVQLKEKTASASSSSTDDRENEELNGEDLRYLENIKHMPLGNPLIRTRRQSLALPTNPDMQICSSHGGVTSNKTKRKSLGILSSSDFKPSQSFFDSIELHKSEFKREKAKRKRLSKSFCGASETLNNSIIDIDARHSHKRSKLTGEDSIAESHQDSIENINTSKLSTKICSTPHEKTDRNYSNNSIQRILTRCDDILEAANRAKLKAKTNNKQCKGKISKKLRKKAISTLTQATDPEDALRKVSKEIKRKVKTKTALSQAIKAADAILGKKKQNPRNLEEIEDEIESKQLPPDVLEAIEKTSSMKKKLKKGNTGNVHTTLTPSGNFMEMSQTPEKKKKPTYIQLSTGKVSVEPITPNKRSVSGFRESPITPCSIGFKVHHIPLPETNDSSSLISKHGKRKRHHNEKPIECNLPKSQWTQSGLFVEEDISKNRSHPRSKTKHLGGGSRKTKIEEQAFNRNFKENAMMRPDIKRSTKRETLLMKERRQKQFHY